MSNVKVLMRRSAIPPPARPSSSFMDRISDAFSSFTTAATRSRKPAGDEPLSLVDRIKESFIANAPSLNIDFSTLPALLAKVKMPLGLALSAAALAGIAYLVYRLYKKFTGDRAQQTVDAFVQDVSAAAPDLANTPGWLDKIRNEASDAVARLPPADLVERLAKIRVAALEHQKGLNPAHVGEGLSTLELHGLIKKSRKRGGALAAPIL